MVGAESLCTWTLGCAGPPGVEKGGTPAHRVSRLAFSSPIFEYVQGTWTPSQPVGLPLPPAKWSFSSDVTENSVLPRLMPSFARRAKNLPNASSYAFSWATYPASPGPNARPVAWFSWASAMYAYVIGTPCSCIWATYPSETAADM